MRSRLEATQITLSKIDTLHRDIVDLTQNNWFTEDEKMLMKKHLEYIHKLGDHFVKIRDAKHG